MIPEEHKMNCGTCGQEIDMRDLSQVFAHEDCEGEHIDYSKTIKITHSGARRIGSPELHTKNNGVINLN